MVEIVKSINDLSLHFNFPHIVYETLLNYMVDEQVRREEAERQTEMGMEVKRKREVLRPTFERG